METNCYRFIKIFFLLLLSSAANAQTGKVSGILRDNTGEPLIGANVFVKGTTRGTVANLDGYYEIEVSVGEVLIYSYIGYLNQEVEVTPEMLGLKSTVKKNHVRDPEKPVGKTEYRSSMKLDNPTFNIFYEENEGPQNEGKGIKKLTDTTARFIMEYQSSLSRDYWNYAVYINANWLEEIKPANSIKYNRFAGSFNNKPYKVYELKNRRPKYIDVPHISFATTLGIQQINKQPNLQKGYAQGRAQNGNNMHQGPETGEILSWGPSLGNLEFDGSIYPFDKNGRLVNRGDGDGVPVASYDPAQFFKKGFTQAYDFSIWGNLNGTLYNLTYAHNNVKGVIPNSYKKQNKMGLQLERDFRQKNTLKVSFNYNNSKDRLMTEGPSLSRLMYSVLTTPASFDNTNGLPSKDAINNRGAYYLDGHGIQRSYSPGNIDNPYWIVNNLPDGNTLSRYSAWISNSTHILNEFTLGVKGGIDYQNNIEKYGLPDGSAGIIGNNVYKRTNKLNNSFFKTFARYNKSHGNFKNSSGIVYTQEYHESATTRNSMYPIHETDTLLFNRKISRNTGEIHLFSSFSYNDVAYVSLKGFMYTSSTLTRPKKYAFMPTMGAAFNFTEALRLGRYRINGLRLWANYGVSYKELPLFYPLGTGNSLFSSTYNSRENVFGKESIYNYDIVPEKHRKYSAGLSYSGFDGRLSADIELYKNNIENHFVPTTANNQLSYANGGNVEYKGLDVTLNYRNQYYNSVNMNIGLTFSKYRSKVTEVYGNPEIIPVAGFTDVHKAIIEGQPYGVIMGNSYLRNSNGELVIDQEGYPVVDEEPKVIGDPTPDFMLGLDINTAWRGFFLNILFDIKKGGDVWNGTSNTLAYYGASEESQNDRNVKGFIYPGVLHDGTVNDIPVDFANPEKGMGSYRHYRYGASGVAEDAIEDGSWLRMKELELGYEFRRHVLQYIQIDNLKISVFASNLFVLTRYKGVDPESTLWGDGSSVGLDYFNMPNLTTYGVKLKLKF